MRNKIQLYGKNMSSIILFLCYLFITVFSVSIVKAQSSVEQATERLKQDSLINYYELIYDKELNSIIKKNTHPDSLLKKLYAFAPGDGSGTGVYTKNYELIDSYMLFKIRINKGIQLSPGISSWISYTINFLRFNSEILYFEFIDYKDTSVKTDNIKFNYFLNSYKKVFNKKTNWKEIIKDTSLIYGDECFYEGEKIKEMAKIENAIKSKNIPLLEDWISSPLPELQAFAVNGFYQLYKVGYKLTAKQQEMVRVVKNKKGELHTCSGCFVEDRDFRDVLSEFTFD